MPPMDSVRRISSQSNVRPANSARTVNIPKTPFTTGRVSLHELKKGAKNTDALIALESLLKQSWTAFSVSPLFTWSSREPKLKRYCRRMSHFLAESLSVEQGDSFEVEYKLVPGLKLNAHDDSAVQLSVNICHENSPRQVFFGYMLSWGFPKAAKCPQLDGILYLPVMLCAGSKKLTTQVCRGLENIHDCVISSLELPETDRKDLWMALLSYLQTKGETITVSYLIPNRPNAGSIELTIASDITTKLSSLILKKHSGGITYEEIALFWHEINNHINNIFGIRVQYCEMVKLQTQQAVVTANKFRASSSKAMHAILLFLTNMSVKLASPTDGAETG